MRFTPTVLTGFAVTSILTGLSNATRSINITAAVELPDCVKTCGARILPEFNCTLGDDCWCDREGPLADQLSECVLSECPELYEALEGLKFQAMTCEYPMDRNIAPVASGVAYTLFALATFFLVARFLSRWPALQGAGLSWDDGMKCSSEDSKARRLIIYLYSYRAPMLHSSSRNDSRGHERDRTWLRQRFMDATD